MSKYDFEIDLSMNSSTGMILSRIRPNSVILEFGCATGRMTRYMKESLGCRVYIVEYDKHAFQKAAEFAEDGICDDIQNYRWMERFGEIAFDAIIFADVLEHLQDPEEVLKKATDLLKDDGCIFVSVPNVTHNDVVLRAVDEHFDYSKTGLLDDSHIHFWGLENLKTLGKGAGLTVRTLDGTHCTTGSTEQTVNLGKNRLLENMLRERQAGETYQFVLTLDKRGGEGPVCTIGAPDIYSYVYLDTGSDFNAEERIPVRAAYSGNGSYLVHFVLTDAERVCKVRLDPVEYQGVVLRSISVSRNGKNLQLIMPNAISMEEGVYLPGGDPMVIAQVQPGKGNIFIDAEFVLPGTEYLRTLENAVSADCKSMEQKQLEIQKLQRQIDELNQQKAELRRQKTELHRQIVALNKHIEEKDQQIFLMDQENKQLQTDVCAYILLANQKEKLALRLKGQSDACAAQRDAYAAERDAFAARAQSSEALVQYYQNLLAIRLRTKIVQALRKIKRIVKKLLRRG